MMVMSTTPFWKSARVRGGGRQQGEEAPQPQRYQFINFAYIYFYKQTLLMTLYFILVMVNGHIHII